MQLSKFFNRKAFFINLRIFVLFHLFYSDIFYAIWWNYPLNCGMGGRGTETKFFILKRNLSSVADADPGYEIRCLFDLWFRDPE
jgi:hypothetical protein